MEKMKKVKIKVVTTNNHKSFNFLASILNNNRNGRQQQLCGVKNNVTNLYLYHNDSNSGLRVLHLLYNKARIGYSSDPNAVEKHNQHRNTVLDRYTIDMIRGMFYTLALVDHRIACLGILCRVSLQA